MHIDWSEVDAQMLPEPFREMASDVGLDTVRYLVEAWGGTVIYIPTLSGLTRKQLDERIQNAYDGGNEYKLAKKFGIPRSRVRRALGK